MDMKNIFLAVILAAIFILPAGVHATWFNTSYIDKIQMTINNSVGANLTNFTMILNQSSNLSVGFNTAALIAAGKMRVDCYDILIVNSTENGAYQHYVENNTCNTPNTIINFVTNLTTRENIFYIYFNSLNATNHQNKKSVIAQTPYNAWFDFDENLGSTTVNFGNPYNTTVANGTLNSISGNIPLWNNSARGIGLSFENPSDYLNLSNIMIYFPYHNAYSFETWIYNDQSGVVDENTVWGDQSSGCGVFGRIGSNNSIEYRWIFFSTTLSDWAKAGNVSLPLNQWTHLVISVSGTIPSSNTTNVTYYRNGISVNSTLVTNGDIKTISGCRNFVFGDYSGASRDWNGTLDNFRFTQGYTISPEEAKAKYNGLASTFAPLQELDVTLPVIAIQSPTNSTYATTNITFNYTASDSFLDSCTRELNGVNSSTSCLNQTFTAVQGNNNVKIYANDTSGNIGIASINFFVDSIVPIVSIQLPANATYNSLNRSLNYTASDANVLVCIRELNGVNSTIINCMNQTFLAAELNNHLKVYARDLSNNSAVASVNFFADDIAPQYSNIIATPASPVNTNLTMILVRFNITAIDNGAVDTVQVRHTGHTHSPIKEGNVYTFSDNVTCGQFTYGWNINDTSGLTNNTPDFIYILNCGLTVPIIHIYEPLNNFYNSTTVPLRFFAYNNETLSTCQYEIDEANVTNIPQCSNVVSANVTMNISAGEGYHGLDMYVNDSFDFVNFSTSNFTVDLTPPNITIISPTINVPSNSPVSVSITLSDLSGVNMSTCFYSLDSGALTPCGGTISVSNGVHSITFYVYDYAGNQLAFTENFMAGLVIVGATSVVLILIPLVLAILLLWILSQKIQTGGDVKGILALFILLIMCIAMIGIIWSVIDGVV